MVWACAALTLAVLAIGLPDDGFFVGDSGVKLIAVRNALAHPFRPFDIDLPAIGGVPAPDLLDPFFVAHGDHAHAETSPIFPLISAPFFALFGLRGLQILPIAGFLGALAGVALMGRRLGDQTPVAATIAFGLVASPLLFYGLEFWEHAVAAALAYLGTALFVTAPRSGARLLLGGVLLGAAVLTRPEALWYLVALFAAARALAMPVRPLEMLIAAAGAALMLAPFAAANAVHFHDFLGPHIAANAGALEQRWVETHAAIAREWFVPTAWPAAALIAIALVVRIATSRVIRAQRAAGLVVLLAAALLGAVAARRGLPRESLWAVFPAALVLWVPIGPTAGDAQRSARRFLIWLIVLDVALVVLTSPNDGGGQWGPRYLMIASGPATLAVWLQLRRIVLERRTLEVFAAGCVIATSALVQRQAYKELRAAKQHYSRVQQALFAETRDRLVLTDVWWLDQISAAHSPAPVFLFAADSAKLADAIRRLEAAHVQSFAIVSGHAGLAAPAIDHWLEGSGFHVERRQDLPGTSLTIYRVDAAGPRPR